MLMDNANSRMAPAQRSSLARKLLVDLSIMTVIGVVLALIGPLGSFADPLATRLIIWVGFSYAGYLIYSPIGWLVEKLSGSLDLPSGWLWVAGTMLATVPMAIVVWSLNQIGRSSFYWPTAQEALIHYAYVLVIGGGITLLFNVIQPTGGSKENEPEVQAETALSASDPQPSANPLLDQLPAELGSEVIALEMEDHYVRVHTALGSELILMRLRDAMVHVAEIDGRQVHRSWWVARGSVEDVRREGRNVRLVLACGIEAPVSRAQVSELKEAGWL